MNDLFRKSALPVMLLASTVLFSGCATQGKPPPTISLDEPVQAQPLPEPPKPVERSEEHTSELQSPCNLVCRLLLEKKRNNIAQTDHPVNPPPHHAPGDSLSTVYSTRTTLATAAYTRPLYLRIAAPASASLLAAADS